MKWTTIIIGSWALIKSGVQVHLISHFLTIKWVSRARYSTPVSIWDDMSHPACEKNTKLSTAISYWIAGVLFLKLSWISNSLRESNIDQRRHRASSLRPLRERNVVDELEVIFDLWSLVSDFSYLIEITSKRDTHSENDLEWETWFYCLSHNLWAHHVASSQ